MYALFLLFAASGAFSLFLTIGGAAFLVRNCAINAVQAFFVLLSLRAPTLASFPPQLLTWTWRTASLCLAR